MTKSATAGVRSYREAREEAGLPDQVKISDIEGKEIVVLSWEPAKATVPETGVETEGYMLRFYNTEANKDQVAFVGQMVLVRELAALTGEFSTRIVRNGRTYKFT